MKLVGCLAAALLLLTIGNARATEEAVEPAPAGTAVGNSRTAGTTKQGVVKTVNTSAKTDKAATGKGTDGVVILEFGDLHCPDSAAFAAEGRGRVLSDFVQSGMAKYEFHDFPLDAHPNAARAAEVARCAGKDVDKIRAAMWQNPGGGMGGDEAIIGQATAAGLDAAAVRECLASGSNRKLVEQDKVLGTSLGVRATPTLVIARRDGGGKFVPIQTVRGDQPYETVRTAIQQAISKAQ